MAGAGYRDWSPGDIPTADQFDTYLQQQTVMVFASAAARNAALASVLAEGLVTYQLDSNSLTVYSGSAWSTVGPVHGAPTSYTPVVVQGATPTLTNVLSWYTRVGRTIIGAFNVGLTSAGTAANTVTVSLPVTSAAVTSEVVGSGYLSDASVPQVYPAITVLNSTTTLKMFGAHLTGTVAQVTIGSSTGASFNAALASGDAIAGTFQYQAAADA